jgi:hypothetical protein
LEPDETREYQAAPADNDETIVLPTFGQPRAGDTPVLPPVSAWSGRAGVPPPLGVRDAVTVDEWRQPDTGRRWWLPVMLALVALALLALLGLGLWLLLRGDSSSDPGAPVAPAPAGPTEPSPSPPGTPTGATTEETRTVPEQVMVPPLVGIDSATAQSILDDAGLTYRLTSRVSADAPAGRVLETDPGEGSLVRKGSRVTLVIALAAPSSSSAPLPSLPLPPVPSVPTPSR